MLVMDLLATPERWTQGVFARDAAQRRISCYDDDAACFCLVGAKNKCHNNCQALWRETTAAMDLEASHRGFDSTAAFNDAPNRTHAEILEFLEAVAKRLGRRF